MDTKGDGQKLSRRKVLGTAGPHEAGGTTSITVTHYGADKGSAVYSQRDQFVMRKSLEHDRQHGQLSGTATTP
jgi:hypothetical protein